jgi:hypothetical protein
MKIGIISDTHIPVKAKQIPSAVLRAMEKVDLILHAGDLVSLEVLEKLKELAPVEAVAGNMDPPEVTHSLPRQKIIEKEKVKIALTHGQGAPTRLIDQLKNKFSQVKVVVFGHSHSPFNQKINDVLYFNPGSPTDKVFTSVNSYGLLKIEEGEVKGEIFFI